MRVHIRPRLVLVLPIPSLIPTTACIPGSIIRPLEEMETPTLDLVSFPLLLAGYWLNIC
jgi:hypothetical protein